MDLALSVHLVHHLAVDEDFLANQSPLGRFFATALVSFDDPRVIEATLRSLVDEVAVHPLLIPVPVGCSLDRRVGIVDHDTELLSMQELRNLLAGKLFGRGRHVASPAKPEPIEIKLMNNSGSDARILTSQATEVSSHKRDNNTSPVWVTGQMLIYILSF